MERSQGIITRLVKLTDTSLIVHVLTPDAGRIKLAAKGARRPNSPFAGKLDLFFGGEFDWRRARHGDLHTLREVTATHPREGLRRDYDATLLGGYFVKLLELAIEPEHPDPPLHDLLRRALDHVDRSGPTRRALRHFEFELTRLLGLAERREEAERALRNLLPRLPPQREQLLSRLPPES